jgi:hypothetical protein
MTSIRKFVYAALLAVTALNLAPTLASAQEPARGKFTLTHEVRWGNAKVPAGDYEFSFDVDGISPLLTLSKISGAPAGFMLLVPMTEEIKGPAVSRLVLESTSDGSYVSAMQLPEFGMTLHFVVPNHTTERQIARAATTASASGQ